MNLRTEVLEIGGQMRIATFYGCGDSGSPREAINHDALAAHALLQAVDEWTMASAVKRRADQLMREWTGEAGK
jgi:hypothetical protein